MLENCVRSILTARPVADLHVHVTVICNGCSDGSADVARRLQSRNPGLVSLLVDRRAGKSLALNAGIAATTGDLVGLIDDDEQVDERWLEVVARAFKDDTLDFIGGPYRVVWETPPPEWLPKDYLAVLGDVDNGAEARPFNREFPGILKGGNAVIRRAVLARVGPFAEHLGPGSFARLFSCEDEDMYWRLLEAGANGGYLPELVIYHYITVSRLSREYYRSWCFWRGVSRGLMDRRHPMPVSYFGGIPRFLWGEAARAMLRLGFQRTRRAPGDIFGDELRAWDVAGYFYGKHLYTLARFFPVPSRRHAKRIARAQQMDARKDELEVAG